MTAGNSLIDPGQAGTNARDRNQLDRVGVKAYARLAERWGLSNSEAAGLIDAQPRTWSRMKRAGWSGALSQDQRLRVSALVGLFKALHLYFDERLADRWVRLPNTGPLFRGSSPIESMLAGGLPVIMDVRGYVDALRGGL